MAVFMLWVAYLRYADKYFGSLASRLKEVYQPVIMTRNRFSGTLMLDSRVVEFEDGVH